MGKLRLRFSKTGRSKYISHLDLMATMQRALIRAGVKLKYSEGFNPHPVMSIALPLSVGCESICELMDFQTADDLAPGDLPGRINGHLPEGIAALEAYLPERKFSLIKYLKFSGSLIYDTGAPERVIERLQERYSAENIVISKKTKSGVSDVDIAPLMRDVEFRDEGSIAVLMKLSAQNPSISPDNFLSALTGDLVPDFAAFKRTEVFDSDMNLFR